ncbi:DUF2628 domain-containing protein [Sporosarcina sp. Marseille-Q4063]|uniref:DUF2628 domain-containing protein n=1 Tax=Sporosarcina sp. Marseille-Q4063 TaxID=2810514 RepID=UPI001BAE6A4C|nr:DUF2628 domain-containing protein [Sporosarcina sp. Marseille-Q4063]QUW21413.1 DUF2628 domain-containing protein [Sporosarcina sp. Marseille-Q4063]
MTKSMYSNELEQHQDPENVQNDDLLKAFVGVKKQSYYFRKWQPDNRRPINWAAVFATFFWLGYRKMYKVIAYILLIFIALDVVILFTGIDGGYINNYIGLGVAVALGIGGNGMYKNHAQKEIEKLQTEYSGDQLLEKVKQRGGTSWGGFWIAVLLFIGYILISIALEILAYLFTGL